MSGLGSYWGEVMEVLREIIPVYDKVNSIISLGKDDEHRNRGISQRVFPGKPYQSCRKACDQPWSPSWIASRK